MKKRYSILLLPLLALFFVSCLPENSDLTAPPLHERQVAERTPANPEDLVGTTYSMADIYLKTANGTQTYYAMPSCLLSVIQVGCGENTQCLAKIDEDDTTMQFTNVAKTAADGTESISFKEDIAQTPNGSHFFFLLDEVFPLIDQADWTVQRQGSDFVLSCSDCPLEYHDNSFVSREIILRR